MPSHEELDKARNRVERCREVAVPTPPRDCSRRMVFHEVGHWQLALRLPNLFEGLHYGSQWQQFPCAGRLAVII